MQTCNFESMAGYLLLTTLFISPCIWFIRNQNKKPATAPLRSVKFMEIIFLILMPIMGLWFYHLLSANQPAQFDWKYHLAIVLIPIIIAAYFISGIAKPHLNPTTQIPIAILLVFGIFMAIYMLIHFFTSVGAVGGTLLFSPGIFLVFFALPYYSLFTVIILLVVELWNLFRIPKHPHFLNIHHEK